MSTELKNKTALKKAIGSASDIADVFKLEGLHPSTELELTAVIHQVQNILIAEYVRFTPLKSELGLV